MGRGVDGESTRIELHCNGGVHIYFNPKRRRMLEGCMGVQDLDTPGEVLPSKIRENWTGVGDLGKGGGDKGDFGGF